MMRIGDLDGGGGGGSGHRSHRRRRRGRELRGMAQYVVAAFFQLSVAESAMFQCLAILLSKGIAEGSVSDEAISPGKDGATVTLVFLGATGL